jgi:hypothetical protein
LTEADWNKSTDPLAMFDFRWRPGVASDRKLRLFTAACCRRLWHLCSDERSRAAVEAGERLADGLLFNPELAAIGQAATDAADEDEAVGVTRAVRRAATRALMAVDLFGRRKDVRRGKISRYTCELILEALPTAQKAGAATAQSFLLREIFGPLPFRPVTLPPSVRTWNDGCVVKLAQAAYDCRRLPAGTLEPERLAVLADALEEAGCDDVGILAHLRRGGVHVRGCWVLDLLTGRS